MRYTCNKIKRKIKSYNFLVKLRLAKMKLYLLCVYYINKRVQNIPLKKLVHMKLHPGLE